MTKREALRYAHLREVLGRYGITTAEVDTLLRAQKTLHTWGEHECNGAIQREGEDGTGRPYWYNTDTGKRLSPVADREAGALKRIQAICEAHGLTYYHQTDPRGCSLYLLRPGDVPTGKDPGAYYSNGIALCL